jgi:hypothetical protein
MNSVVTTPESLHAAGDSRQFGLAGLRVLVDIPAIGVEFEQFFEGAWDYFRVPGRPESRGRNANMR